MYDTLNSNAIETISCFIQIPHISNPQIISHLSLEVLDFDKETSTYT